MKDKHLESKKRLEHILKAIEDTQKFVHHKSMEDFCEDAVLHNAVLFNFTVMGEAVVHIETEKLANYEYPWYKVRSFRNMIAHEYFNIKLSAVWAIIENELPQLKNAVKTVLKQEFE